MKFLFVSFLSFVLAANAGWDCDQRCPGYNACMKQNANSRLLIETEDPSMIEDANGNATWPIRHSTSSAVSVSSSSNLRGSDTVSHRKLESLLEFQLRLFWEEGACWQEEWREREWCLRCKGDSCSVDDYLVLDECSGSSKQKFLYRPVPGSGGGKIMPYTKPELCWTRTRVNAHQLQPCGDDLYTDDKGRDVQIIIGFDPANPSELHPNGVPHKCMDNHHHPKRDEIVRAANCEVARITKTNKWAVINKSTTSIDPPPQVQTQPVTITTSNASPRTDSLPPVKPLGKEYCDTHTCGLCEGDCDNDDQCEGDLKCFQRGPYQEVPGCSGGHESHSKTDYCYDPNAAGRASGAEEPPKLDYVSSSYCQSSQKCGLCQGDCDDDDDCEGNLVCHQRGRYDPVPGCRGGESDKSKSDYCVEP